MLRLVIESGKGSRHGTAFDLIFLDLLDPLCKMLLNFGLAARLSAFVATFI